MALALLLVEAGRAAASVQNALEAAWHRPRKMLPARPPSRRTGRPSWGVQCGADSHWLSHPNAAGYSADQVL
ncbi:hypothetical protein GCM10010276_38140 [Streptomyces longisporus]|uniref:Secreted protein n=1 Tax=Streptomyces longisporus TaxID=1948 RepID=A0ABP5Z8N7_STRLO